MTYDEFVRLLKEMKEQFKELGKKIDELEKLARKEGPRKKRGFFLY